jgi:acylphosphatase
MPDARYRVRVYGRVQGVGFRAATRSRARSLGLSGWVRNRQDGSVEAAIEGASAEVDEMLAWLRHGPPGAQVTDLQTIPEAPTGDVADFSVRYDGWE